MSQFAEKVRNQVSDSLEQLTKAGRGLVARVTEQSNKQFQLLVKTGEAQKKAGKTLADQLKESLEDRDLKASIDQLRLAALGLFTKTKTSGEKYFNELVKLGETQATPLKNKAKNTGAGTSKKSGGAQ